MPAYVVASIEVNNWEGFQKYLPGSAAAIQAHGGEVVAADSASAVLEGPARPLTVVIRFADRAAAEAWYRSSEYQGIIHHRHDNADSSMVIADGFVSPS